MKIVSKGSKTFIQTYNPMNIAVIAKNTGNQIVYRFYPSADQMPTADKASYYAALRMANSLMQSHRVRGA